MRRLIHSPTAAILTAAGVFYAVFIARTAFRVNGTVYFTLFDDAMISMRYARNLAHGHGLVWNAGDHPVEGYTNLLWTLWMAFLHLLRLPEAKISLAVAASGAMLLIANALVVGTIARRVSPSRAVRLVAIALTAFYYPLVYWTLRGMEVGLLTLLISVAILMALRLESEFSPRDLGALCATFAAALLTRTDAVVFCVVIAAYVVLQCRTVRARTALAVGGTIAVTLVGVTAFRLAYYGVALPNTYYLKLHDISLGTRLPRGLLSLASVELFHLWAPTLIAASVLVWLRPRPPAFLLAAVFLAGCAYSLYVGGDAWEWMQYSNRYVTPGTPGLLILSAIGLEAVVTRAGPLKRRQVILPIGFIAIFVFTMHSWIPGDRLQFGAAGMAQPVQVGALLLAIAWAIIPRHAQASSSGGQRIGRSSALAVLVISFIVGIEGFAFVRWGVSNADYAMTLDAPATRYGLALRAATSPNATIAVTAAGAITYFSQRRTIDLLGKSDHTIAMERPQKRPFLPGHAKWDYRYSIEGLRPDVVADLFSPSKHDLTALRAWGYSRLVSRIHLAYVRDDDPRVDLTALAGFLKNGAEPADGLTASAP